MEILNIPDPKFFSYLANIKNMNYFHRKLPYENLAKKNEGQLFIINPLIENILEENSEENIEKNKRKFTYNPLANLNNILKDRNYFYQPDKIQNYFSENKFQKKVEEKFEVLQNKIVNLNFIENRLKNDQEQIKLYEDSVQCNFENCGRIFKNKYKLNDHLVVHSKDKKFICIICKKKFKRQQTLNRHTRYGHENTEGKHKCKFCSKGFKNFTCKIIIIYSIALLYHERKHHLLYFPYKCVFRDCVKEFPLKNCLVSHIRQFHKVKEDQ